MKKSMQRASKTTSKPNAKSNANRLSRKNIHNRDKDISFQEYGHIYNVKGDKSYTSVTKLVHRYVAPFDAKKVIASILEKGTNVKYIGMTAEEIDTMWKQNGKEAREAGTKMHYGIECHYNDVTLPTLWDNLTAEQEQFSNFLTDHPHLEAYRTEWAVYDEEHHLSGSIDMVFKNSNGKFDIYDWKRTKEIKTSGFSKFKSPILSYLPDTNFWHYSLQLNIYKYILETNYSMEIGDLYLVAIYPGQTNYIKYKAPDLQNEVREIIAEHKLKLTPSL